MGIASYFYYYWFGTMEPGAVHEENFVISEGNALSVTAVDQSE